MDNRIIAVALIVAWCSGAAVGAWIMSRIKNGILFINGHRYLENCDLIWFLEKVRNEHTDIFNKYENHITKWWWYRDRYGLGDQ